MKRSFKEDDYNVGAKAAIALGKTGPAAKTAVPVNNSNVFQYLK